MDIDYWDFENFIKECLEMGSELINKNDWEVSVIQIIEKYDSTQNPSLKMYLNKKLGNLILFNPQYKNFDYLRKLEKFFYSYSQPNSYFKQNSQIKYLLILVNNLVEIKTSPIKIKRQKPQPVDLMDFIFDYYLNDL